MEEDLYPAFNLYNFKSLAQQRDLYCVSIFLPFYLMEENGSMDLLEQLTHYVDLTKYQLDVSPLNTIQKREYLRELKGLFNNLPPKEERDLGLALFISQQKLEAYFLPITFQFRVVVNDHFYLQPITHLFNADCRFLFVFLAENQTELISVVDHHSRKSHTFNNQWNDQPTYFKEISDCIQSLLVDDSHQIILLGPQSLTDSFAKMATHLPKGQLVIHRGDTPETTQFLTRLTSAYAHYFQSKKGSELWKKVQQSAGFTDNIEEVISAAVAGKVKTLFLFEDHDVYGEYDHDNHFVLPHSSNIELGSSLSNIAAIHTILHGGNTWFLPKDSLWSADKVMAVLRS